MPVQALTAADAWRAVIERRISLTPAFDGKVWSASTDVKGSSRHNHKRAVRSVSAVASSPIGAIKELVQKLDAEAEQRDCVY